ncbi:MAG: hypothetical protein ACOC6I_01295 [Candidatus Bipolaricaulota bacterium]
MNSLDILKEASRKGKLTHAYLAPVKPGTDVDHYARELGRVILCSPDDEKCQKKVLRNVHPDFFRITVLNNNRKISINQVEKIITGSSYSPQEEDRKLFAIGPAEDLSREGSNSLLKVLEDPPAFVYFLLLTENPNVLLPTIVSRCQQLPRGGMSSEGMREILRDRGFSKEESGYLMEVVNERADLLNELPEEDLSGPLERRDDSLSKYSEANLVELSENLVEAESYIDRDVIAKLMFEKIGESGRFQLIVSSEKIQKLSRDELAEFLEKGLHFYRQNYRKVVGEGGSPGRVSRYGSSLEKVQLINRAIESLKTNANVQLLMDNLWLQLANRGGTFKRIKG